MLALAATFFGRRWHEGLYRRAETDGLGAFIPHDKDEVDDARVWLAFCELGRNQEQVGWSVETLRDTERQMLDTLTRHSLDEVTLDQLVAVLADFAVAHVDGGTFGSAADASTGRPCGR